jgi:hypothetical protein
MLDQLKKLQKYQSSIVLGLIIAIAVIAIALYVIDTKKNEEVIAVKEAEVKFLNKRIWEMQQEQTKEVKYRDQLRYDDSITIEHLKFMLKRDSLLHVRNVNVLLKEIKKLHLTDQELDQELIKIYEELNSN